MDRPIRLAHGGGLPARRSKQAEQAHDLRTGMTNSLPISPPSQPFNLQANLSPNDQSREKTGRSSVNKHDKAPYSASVTVPNQEQGNTFVFSHDPPHLLTGGSQSPNSEQFKIVGSGVDTLVMGYAIGEYRATKQDFERLIEANESCSSHRHRAGLIMHGLRYALNLCAIWKFKTKIINSPKSGRYS